MINMKTHKLILNDAMSKVRIGFYGLAFILLLFAYNQDDSQTDILDVGPGAVYLIHVEGLIDNGLHKYLDRGLAMAQANAATGIVLYIDTFGGLVDAADNIRKSILDSNLPIVAFIDKNAASAGALIAIATDSIYMAPGASIGAATVVDGSGEYAAEKMQSYMRGLMRSTAEAKNRDPRIAEAMVDETI